MKWEEVEALASMGEPVRRSSWPATRSVVFSAGSGTTRAVGVMRDGSTSAVLTNLTFTAAEFAADDWRPAPVV